MRLKPLLAFILVLVLALAGCGGSSKKSSSKSETTTTKQSTSTSDSSSGGGDENKIDVGGDGAKSCDDLAKIGQKLSEALTAANASAAGDPGKQLDNTIQLMRDFAALMPDEIKPDMEVFIAALEKAMPALQAAQGKPGQQPTPEQMAALTQAMQAFNDPKLKQANAHMTAWAKKNCSPEAYKAFQG